MTDALLFVMLLFGHQSPGQVPGAGVELAAARALYVSAAYEDALERLDRIASAEVADEVDTYRALCLLALGRTRETEQVLEQLLERNPRFALNESETSPRLVLVYRAVRARLLPATARQLYATARASFDAGEYPLAVRQLREVLALLGPEATSEGGLSDLRVLAEGFLRLAESVSGTQAGAGDGESPVYTTTDRDVIAPVEITRAVPIWEAPRGTKPGLYQGVVVVVINEFGRVESATVTRSIEPAFDALVLQATAAWRFQPAMRAGVPVKYRRAYEVIGHSRVAAAHALRIFPHDRGETPLSWVR